MCLILFKSLFVVINNPFVLFSYKLLNSDRHLPILWLKIVLKNAFRTNLFNMNHISQIFSIRFFSSGDFCNKYHIFGKNHSSNDKVTVCRSKKRYHWSKTSMICFYHQIPRLSADTWARPPPPGVSWYMDDPYVCTPWQSLLKLDSHAAYYSNECTCMMPVSHIAPT